MKEELIEYGLSEREVSVFIMALKTGEATANRISELVNLLRSTTYDVLERLKNMGLITTVNIGGKAHFTAADLSVLITSLEEKKNKIKKIIPEIKEIRNKVIDKPIAEVFMGKVAIIKLLEEILDNAKEIRLIGSQENAFKVLDYHPNNFRLKRLENKINVKEILEDSNESRSLKGNKFTKTRFLDSLINSREATFIFDKYVYHLLLHEEISAIKIISEEHAKSNSIAFDELWKIAKK